jgi:3-phosphoshikimate 1-carboxyvinyltransferase
VDLTASPDLYPLVGAIAATIPGVSELRGAEHVAFKESDRRAETVRLARAIGAEVRASRHVVRIRGVGRPRAFRLRGLTDHRLVMSAGVAGLVGPSPSTVDDARVVAKSFPQFWTTLAGLREASRP